MKVKVYDLKSNTIKEKDIDIKIEDLNEDLVAQYVRVYLSNQRQGTSKVKTRSEVRGGGRKPWRQKGTGRARAGSIRSPLWRGGGVVHGPEPKSWNLSMNKKMKRKVFLESLSQKIRENKFALLSGADNIKEPSLSVSKEFINKNKLSGQKLLVVHNNSENLYKSFRNIKDVTVRNVVELSAFDILSADYVLISENSVGLIEKRIK